MTALDRRRYRVPANDARDHRYWQGRLRDLSETDSEVWHAAEQYALYVGQEQRIRLLNLLRSEVERWAAGASSWDGTDPQVFADFAARLDDLASEIGGEER